MHGCMMDGVNYKHWHFRLSLFASVINTEQRCCQNESLCPLSSNTSSPTSARVTSMISFYCRPRQTGSGCFSVTSLVTFFARPWWRSCILVLKCFESRSHAHVSHGRQRLVCSWSSLFPDADGHLRNELSFLPPFPQAEKNDESLPRPSNRDYRFGGPHVSRQLRGREPRCKVIS